MQEGDLWKDPMPKMDPKPGDTESRRPGSGSGESGSPTKESGGTQTESSREVTGGTQTESLKPSEGGTGPTPHPSSPTPEDNM